MRSHNHRLNQEISIHALLAESDMTNLPYCGDYEISIHALLAESDHTRTSPEEKDRIFLSTLSLRRATND